MEQSKYTALYSRKLRSGNRKQHRQAMTAESVSLGAVIMAAMLAFSVGASL